MVTLARLVVKDIFMLLHGNVRHMYTCVIIVET